MRLNMQLVGAMGLLLVVGCAEQTKRAPEEQVVVDDESQFAPVIQTTPLADELRQAHQLADDAATNDERSNAALKLESLFDEIEHNEPHGVALKQDLAARIATLRLRTGAAEEARVIAQQGLALSKVPTVLRANLFIALADAEEKLSNQQAAQDALLSALSINESLFNAELESP